MTESAIYTGSVLHRRLKPKRYSLRHKVFWLLLDLDAIDRIAARLRVFSHNRFNLLAFHDRDHGDGSATPLAVQVRQRLAEAGMPLPGGGILLLAMPRILGYVFNPLSVYFCTDASGMLRALLYEVHNTFGERHTYTLPVEHPAGGPVEQQTDKRFHVSPFLAMGMRYAFRVAPPGETVSVAIRADDDAGPVLFAALSGRQVALSDAALLRVLAGSPLMTVKVVAAIHCHALRMALRGFRIYRHPPRDTAARPSPNAPSGARGP